MDITENEVTGWMLTDEYIKASSYAMFPGLEIGRSSDEAMDEEFTSESGLLLDDTVDLENLLQQWENILKVSETSNPPNLIKRDDDFSLKILRDHIKESTKSIIIDSKYSVARAKDFLKNYESDIDIEFHDNSLNQHIFEKYEINKTIQK